MGRSRHGLQSVPHDAAVLQATHVLAGPQRWPAAQSALLVQPQFPARQRLLLVDVAQLSIGVSVHWQAPPSP